MILHKRSWPRSVSARSGPSSSCIDSTVSRGAYSGVRTMEQRWKYTTSVEISNAALSGDTLVSLDRAAFWNLHGSDVLTLVSPDRAAFGNLHGSDVLTLVSPDRAAFVNLHGSGVLPALFMVLTRLYSPRETVESIHDELGPDLAGMMMCIPEGGGKKRVLLVNCLPRSEPRRLSSSHAECSSLYWDPQVIMHSRSDRE